MILCPTCAKEMSAINDMGQLWCMRCGTLHCANAYKPQTNVPELIDWCRKLCAEPDSVIATKKIKRYIYNLILIKEG